MTLSPKVSHLTMLEIPIPYNDLTQVQKTKIESFHGHIPSELPKIWNWYILYNYMMCYEVREMKKHAVCLSGERGREEERLPLLPSILFHRVS